MKTLCCVLVTIVIFQYIICEDSIEKNDDTCGSTEARNMLCTGPLRENLGKLFEEARQMCRMLIGPYTNNAFFYHCVLQQLRIINQNGVVRRRIQRTFRFYSLPQMVGIEEECYDMVFEEDEMRQFELADEDIENYEGGTISLYLTDKEGIKERLSDQTPASSIMRKIFCYVSCLHKKYNKACNTRANYVLNKFAEQWYEKYTFEDDDSGIRDKAGQLIDNVPGPMFVEFPASGLIISPGTVAHSQDMLVAPKVYWECEEDTYYTIMATMKSQFDFTHWLVYNIPGNNVAAGSVGIFWVGLISVFIDNFDAGGRPPPTLNLDPPDFDGFPAVFYAYKQPGMIDFEEKNTGCQADLATQRRAANPEFVKNKYNLTGPVASNFIGKIPINERIILVIICQVNACLSSLGEDDTPFTPPGLDCDAILNP